MIKTITKVLERENLKEYMPLFEGEGITDDIIDTLTDKDLDDLGIKKLGERRRILLGFAEGISGQFDMNIMTTVAGGVLPEESEFKGKKVEAFRIGKYPVTQMEWDRVRLWGLAHGFKMESGEANGNRHPITLVNWYDAVKWCNARSCMEGLNPVYNINGKTYSNGEYGPDGSVFIKIDAAANGYRLPAEIEWEWAARGGALSRGFKFSGSDNVDIVSWYDKNANGASHAVGQKAPNELGIHDMSGNVWEWCWDRDETGAACRIRGGSCMHVDGEGSVSYRVSRSPEIRYTVIGFRLARNM
jgi:formylglycine-generating enzyme required for sulfatase activity